MTASAGSAMLDDLIGESPAILAVRNKLERLLGRPTDGRRLPPILIQGETGVGKGLLARAIHRAGPRATGPFVDVNCAAIPETLLEAEMFGFERGAFTDARQAKQGLFQAAHGGTLFLDEIGLLPESLQAKLLKVIEERQVRRLGSVQSESVDIWLLGATSLDLQAATRERRFREDLYHRLAVLTVWLPPLRERGDDILLLAERFLAKACADYGLAPRALDGAARAALLAYPWPGNVRELANAMERAALLADTPVITATALGLPARDAVADAAAGPARAPLFLSVERVEQGHVLDALRATSWNVSRAAARLGLSRNTLRYRIEKYGLRPGGSPRPARRPAAAAPEPRAPSPAGAGPGPPALEGPLAGEALAGTGPPMAIRWERRRVTLLRAVLVSPGETGALLDASRALETLIDKVRSFGGQVESLSPTGVVAAFGIEPLEDAPRHAANAAMAIQRAAVGGWSGAEWLSVRIGIHTSQVMIGRVGGATRIDEDGKRESWTVLERLTAEAAPGAVLVSPAAAGFLERRFDLIPTGPGSPTGPAYRLGRLERPEFEPGPRLSRLVGRQRELELLGSLLAAATAEHGQAVGIVGEPGIGKSRLLYEFRQSLAGKPVTYLEAHCFEYGTSVPYLPIVEILRQSCGITESDGPGAIVEKARVALAAVGMAPEESLAYILHLLGVAETTERLAPSSPEATKSRTFETLRQLTLLGSRRRPIVLAIEDLHWIDSISAELIASLVDSLAGAAVLLLATYRPGYRPPWMDRSYATQVALGPLLPDESLAVVQAVLQVDRVPPPLAQPILDRAQGNPFFLEELARTVRASGALGSAVAIPDTLQEALLTRIDRLDDTAKRLLLTASVLGRKVSPRLLREIWPEPTALEPHLRELTRLEVLREEAGAAEPLYVFTHALTQEIAYASLPDDARRLRHGAAGRALERIYAGRTGEIVERLAYHFGRSDDGEKAVDYALLAAEKAQERWANVEALAYFDAARRRLEAMPDTSANRARRIDAVVKPAEVMFALGQHADHIRALEAIRPLVDTADRRRQAAWHCWTGFLHSLTGGRPEVAIEYCRKASVMAEAEGYEDIRAYADCCLAHVYVLAGDLRASVAAGERALATFDARGNAFWACRTLWALAPAANALGEWARALAYCRRALDHGLTLKDLRLHVVGLWRTGSTHILRGDPAAGVHYCEEALALSPSPFDAAMARAMRGYGLVKAGAVEEGTAELEAAVGWFGESRLRYTRSSFGLRLAEGYLRRGDRPKARAALDEALATSQELGYRCLEGTARRLRGEALLADSPAAAAAELETAERILDLAGARDEVAKTWVVQADLARATGDARRARELFTRALAVFEALGTLDEPPRVRAALAALTP